MTYKINTVSPTINTKMPFELNNPKSGTLPSKRGGYHQAPLQKKVSVGWNCGFHFGISDIANGEVSCSS